MLGLTALGTIHTAISLVALGAGTAALVRHREIRLNDGVGRLYAATTALTAATGLGIFQHGGFGPPHVLSILTLLALSVALVASRGWAFGRHARAVEVVCGSATVLFHLIPAVGETATRLPLGAPLAASVDAPGLQMIDGVLLALFVAGATWQVRQLRDAPTGSMKTKKPQTA